MVSAFTVHVLPAGKLWSLYAHLTPLPSQIITFMALFIDATSPLVPVTHAPTNHCQIAKHVNSIQSQPSIPTRDVSRRTGRRGRQRTSKVKSEGRCRVTGMVMTTRVHATQPRSPPHFSGSIHAITYQHDARDDWMGTLTYPTCFS